MQYKKMRLQDIKPYENNPRINDAAVDDVAESIKQCTYISPIIIDEDCVILAGHTRHKALQKLGYTECNVLVVSGLTEAQKKKYRLYDNKTSEFAEWDQKKLIQELTGIDFQGYDFGQPVKAEIETTNENGKKTVICPCCREEFEV